MATVRVSPPVLLVVLAGAVRALVAWRTAMPERDAAHYLWMADGLELGAPERLFQSVFHPGFPALVGVVRAAFPALETVVAGQLVACTLSALAVWPLWAMTRRLFGEHAALAAGLCFALGTWFVRHPADVLSEGMFHLLVVACAALLIGRARESVGSALAAGCLAALAYGVRPEGASLGVVAVVWLWVLGARTSALAFAAGASVAFAFPLGWALLGPGFTLTPKAAFIWADGVGQDAGGVLHYLEHLLRVPGAFVEALGYVVAPAAVVGAVLAARGTRRAPVWLLLAPFLVQIAIVPILRSNQRFLSGYGVLLLPFAGYAWARLRPYLEAHGAVVAVFVLAFAADLGRLPQARRADRVVERQLGTWLGGQRLPGERVASDMQRLDYFAGVEPAPPRTIRPEELESAARVPAVRFVVWVEGRTDVDDAAVRAAGLHPVDVPPALDAAVRERGIVVRGR